MVLDDSDPDTRSVGSFFMNPVVTLEDRERIASTAGDAVPGFAMADGRVKIPAAWLIERSGVRKGTGERTVGLSTKHPLAIVNRGGATSRDVIGFAVRSSVPCSTGAASGCGRSRCSSVWMGMRT